MCRCAQPTLTALVLVFIATVAIFVQATPQGPVPAGSQAAKPKLQDSSGQVSIKGSAQPNASTPLPILALSYTGDGGPHNCRGALMSSINLPKPATLHMTAMCYDMPRMARCGIFIADKADGCEARLYNSPGCPERNATYMNTVVFMPEERVVGSSYKSISVRCGIQPPEQGTAVNSIPSLSG